MEDKNAVLELTYNYGVIEYDKGNVYAQFGLLAFLKIALLFTIFRYSGTDNFYPHVDRLLVIGSSPF